MPAEGEFQPVIGPCFHCGRYGHIRDDCDERKPTKDYAEHKRRIDLYNQRRESGQWDWAQKREAISHENEMYYGKQASPLLIIRRKAS